MKLFSLVKAGNSFASDSNKKHVRQTMIIKKIGLTLVVAASLALSACGGGSSSDESTVVNTIDVEGAGLVGSLNKIGSLTPASEVSAVSNDYMFPSIEAGDAGFAMTIPNGALPGFSNRRTIEAGTGATIGYGDVVNIKYDMFSWATGEMVESTNQLGGDLALQLTDNAAIPNYLKESILGRKAGEKMQVVFEASMEDLPDYMNNEDAYVLVVELME